MREGTLGIVGEFVAHIMDGLVRHPNSPSPKILAEKLFEHIHSSIATRSAYDAYKPLNQYHIEFERDTVRAVSVFIRKAQQWAKEPLIVRKIYVKVLLIGGEPVLEYDVSNDALDPELLQVSSSTDIAE